MAETVFILCAVVSIVCTFALFKGYNKSRNKLLLWSALCFLLLSISHVFLCVDLILLPQLELDGPFWRNLLSASAGMLLLSGLIMEIS